MNCEETRKHLSPYMDGELRSTVRTVVESHLETCPDCSLHYEELKRLRDDVASVLTPDLEVSETFTRELLSRSRREFHLRYATGDSDGGTLVSFLRDVRTLVSGTTLVLGLLTGGMLGWSVLDALRQPPVRTVRSSDLFTTGAGTSTPIHESANVVSFTDAYFEITERPTPGEDS